MPELFTENQTTVSPVADLVGEGKKFKTVEDLAKSKLEADNFINTLQDENKAARERLAALEAELATRKTVEDQLKAISTTKVVPQPPATTVTEPAKGQVLTDEDLTKRVKAITEAEQAGRQARQNIEAVSTQMTKTYGSEEKAREIVQNKARELGVSVQFLQDAAAKSPVAFFNLIGEKTTIQGPTVTRSDVNPSSFTQLPIGNANPAPDTYIGMRNTQGRLDVKKLMDPNYLRTTHEQALKNPDKFFDGVAVA